MTGKKRKHTPRCTAVDKQNRISIVANLLADGMGLREIMANETVRQWALEKIEIRDYMRCAWVVLRTERMVETQDKIDKEPPTVWQRMKKLGGVQGAELEDGDDVGAMLARLRELSV